MGCGTCGALAAAAVMASAMGLVWLIFGLVYGSFRSISPSVTIPVQGRKIKVTFLHPDFGIGGAENLIVNCAVALQRKGYDVHICTSHHDRGHCFRETRGDGPLAKCIVVYGDYLPRTVFGRLYAFCAFLRMVYITLRLFLAQWETDVFFLDQVSLPIPLLRAYFNRPVYFYGHYPDKLLCTDRSSMLKRLYRMPLDALEEATTRAADTMVVNSKYTASVFAGAFPSLDARHLSILYPPVDISTFARPASIPTTDKKDLHRALQFPALFVSLNRFERKKNIALAVEALAWLESQVSAAVFATVHLVLAGGYDPLNAENVAHYDELAELVATKKLTDKVTFLRSISDSTKHALLLTARAILYTPSFEHFGIVPVEAMASGTPVVAVNTGGPLESVAHDVTGFLCDQEPVAFGHAMQVLATDAAKAKAMGEAGVRRAMDLFSIDVFASTLDQHMQRLVTPSSPHSD
ncbi:hypothetical protein H310_04062 [Aphanomyces invadans]|uniref:Alpha-1,3/1,6-mannosyltransferase ALG2 n=1 Tax=Aphanomyces invadans TaxID=157072 RepID=A0A024UHB9_9STRA|nr:hypothetical protein H310_04062 [Aphanomyces invadans]ETW04998.1 hypothetical protein H310_04062 [Aphanomyces invadans]|eukprot:XP_008866436.1 hypothetical protein H310_04062 [Aphanomyces invadans]